MMQTSPRGGLTAFIIASLVLAGCSDSDDTFQPAPDFSVDPTTIDVSQADVCDIVQPDKCAFPYPSNFFTLEDSNTATGRRVNLNATAIPGTSEGVAFDPTEYNRNDGFSPGPLLLLEVPGIDLEQTGAAVFTDMGGSQDADAPIQVINAATGERQLLWTELDSRPAEDEARALMIRLARNLQDGERYIVALQNLVASDGSTIPSSDAFTVFKEGIPSDIPAFEDRRDNYEDIFAILEANGVSREDLYLAWDFTVASTESIAGRMLHIRDQSFADLGGSAPVATILSVESPDESENADLGRRIAGTLSVPNFLNTGTGAPGSRFNYDSSDPDALPARFGGNGSVDVDFTCVIPRQALADSSNTIAVVIGHGLYGSRESVDDFAPVAEEQNIMFCGMDSWGMSSSDLGVAFASLSNINNFPQQADRIQQGFLNITLLSEAMRHPDGFAALDAFRDGDRSLFQAGAVHYEGISQGGVLGAALSAINPNFQRSALNVAGMRFSLLARRSNAWGGFAIAFDPAYPDPLDKPLVWSVIQMLYDRGENNGYVNHVTRDPLPGSTESRVLIHLAIGDKTVSETAGEILARSMDVPRHLPSIVEGRHQAAKPYLNIEGIPAYPWEGNGLVLWDSGPFPIAGHDGTPLQATVNNFEPAGYNTHGMTFGQRAARDQKAAFWRTGQVTNVCGETACFGDGYDGTPGEYSPPN